MMRNPTARFEAACLALSLLCAGCGSAPTTTAGSGGAPSSANDSASDGDPAAGANTPSATTVGSGTARGSVQGQTLTPKSAASATYINDGDYLLIVLSSQADYCAATTAGQTHANHRSLVSILFSADAEGKSSQALGAGTYTISSEAPTKPGLYANAAFNASDASCESLMTGNGGSATSGTITLTAVTSKALAGTYSLKFGSDTVTGTFSAPDCVALAEQAASGTPLTCEP